MRRLTFLLATALLLTGLLVIVNCSKPLESSRLDEPKPPIIIVDTLYSVDTILIGDSTTQYDTVIMIDTIIRIDTVVIVEPDTTGMHFVCDRLGSNRKEVIWMIGNSGGDFLLEFGAVTEREHPTQILVVDIDGKLYEWPTAEGLELTVEQHLSAKTTIRIETDAPNSYGHAIDICLTINEK
ncbi:MAG: hypothetical protein V3T31_08705 [candidate division Zixibacteria bacterium]